VQRFAAFALSREEAMEMRAPAKVLDLPGISPSAVAMWRGDLYVGTEDGRVVRAARSNR
jgi:hypothetical protein